MADFYLENCTHEEAVNALKKCKEKVTFVVDKAEQHYPSSPTIGTFNIFLEYKLDSSSTLLIIISSCTQVP